MRLQFAAAVATAARCGNTSMAIGCQCCSTVFDIQQLVGIQTYYGRGVTESSRAFGVHFSRFTHSYAEGTRI